MAESARMGRWGGGPKLLSFDEVLGWTPFAWLLYLPIFLTDPIAHSRAGVAPVWLWPLTILGMAVFLVSYFIGYRSPRRHLIPIAMLQTALGAAFAPINTGSSVFFVYAAAFAGQLSDTRNALRMIALITVLCALTAWLTNAPSYFWLGGVALSPLIGAVNLHFARVGRTQRSLKLAQDEIQHLATVAERERIGRDLHDVLGHTLSLIILKSELASKLAERDPARALREIRDVEAVARKALQDVREAIRGYRATLSDEVERARSLLKAADVHAEFHIAPFELSGAQAETLALALREGVTNVVRHAHARHCTITVRSADNAVLLEIFDDGRGGAAPEGAGLRGMRERIEMLGGSVRRNGDRGLQLTITLPLPERAAPALVPAQTQNQS